jgi:hypothetical protein
LGLSKSAAVALAMTTELGREAYEADKRARRVA